MSATPASISPPAPPPPPAVVVAPRPRRKHRLLKLTIVLLVALLIVLVTVVWFLGTDYPRQIAVRVAQNVTGLRVEIGKLDLTLGGRTTIDDLRVSLPLADRPFLTVDHVNVEHRMLAGILFTLDPAIRRLNVSGVRLDARQQTDGVWNLQQVLNQLSTPGKNATAGNNPPTLPAIDVIDVAATVTLADGKTAEFKNVTFTGAPRDALAYVFRGDAGGLATLDGELSATGRWPHRASVVVKPALLKAIEPLSGVIPTVVSLQVDWQGERTNTGLAGRLTIPEKSTQAGPVIASGAMRVTVDGPNISVSPDDFGVSVPGIPPVTLAGGTATLTGTKVTLSGVRARFADGSARLSGSADLAKQRGSVTAAWEQVAYPAGVIHQGQVTLEAANIWPSRPWVKGELFVLGTAAGGTFETQAVLGGDGPTWTDATYVVDLPVVRYSRQSELRVRDIRAVFHNTADTVELTGVRTRQSASGPATLDARGVYHFAGPDRGTGYLTAVGQSFRFGSQDNLAFNVNAWADGDSITLQNAYARLGTDAWANLAGQYVFSRPEPVGMQLDFGTDPALSLKLSNTMNLAGRASGSMKVGGTLTPTHVKIEGTLQSRKLKLDQLLIGDADLVVRGLLLPEGASLQTERLRAFGGEGWFGVDFPYFSDQLHTWMGFDKIDLASIGKAVGTDRVSGTADGQFDLHVPVGDLQRLYGTGRIDLARPAARPVLAAQSLNIPVRIGDGYVSVTPSAKQDAGGTAGIWALISLNEPTKFRLSVDLKNWLTQLPLQEFSTLTTGRIDMPQFDFVARAVSGSVTVKNEFFAHDKPIGNVGVRLKADGQQVKLESIDGRVLGGSVYGQGMLDFNDLAQGSLKAGVVGLSLDRLAQIDPRLDGVQGQLSATIDSHAATGENPLGPLQADVDIKSDRATYKGIDIGDTRVRLFADRTRVAMADDPQRPNTVSVAGGTARLWGRVGAVPAGEDGVARTSAFVSVHLDRLDTEQLNQMIDPDGKAVPGRISGNITAFGNPADVTRLSGQGRLDLTESDLANVGPLAVLYNAMRLGFAPATPSGEGSVAFRLNAGKLDITGLNYFNRGIYARGALTFDNVLNLKDSHLAGYMIGTYRPLKDLKLPFFGTLDSILDALQSSATTIRIDGTTEKPNAVPASLKQISGNLKNILVGESQAK